MRVLIAPDSFTGTLTATQAAEAMASGWRATAPHDTLTLLPLSDGGPGFVDMLAAAVGGEVVLATVSDPLGRPVPAAILVVDDAGGRTAYVEAAQSCGLHLLSADERDPGLTSTWGVGELIELAVAEGARRVVLGLGGCSTNDGGAGMLAALGAGPPERLARGGAALADLGAGDLDGLRATRDRLSGVELVIASDVENPLLGFKGTSAVLAPELGATPVRAQQLEAALGHLTDIVNAAMGGVAGGPFGLDLLSGAPRRPERTPGAGAAGGLAYGLLLLGAHIRSGIGTVLDLLSFQEQVRSHDLLVTGEGRFDWASLQGSVVSGVASAALAAGTPVVVVAGQVMIGRRETMTLGVNGCYAVAETPDRVEAAMTDPVGTLRERTSRVAATWSPRP